MNRLLTVFIILTIGCTSKDKLVESSNDNTDNEFVDLNDSEKLGVFSQIGEEFKGDYRKYSGQNDSTKAWLTLNKDNRFALGFKRLFKPKSTDSLITFEFSTTNQFKNMCIGRWTEEGENIKLKFLIGQSEFFDSLRNEGIKFIDDKTVLLDKDAKEVWIVKTLCERQ